MKQSFTVQKSSLLKLTKKVIFLQTISLLFLVRAVPGHCDLLFVCQETWDNVCSQEEILCKLKSSVHTQFSVGR